MTFTIVHRRSSVAGHTPTTSQLNLGELSINTNDGILYFMQQNSTTFANSIVTIGNTSNYLPLAGGTLTGTVTGGSFTGGTFTSGIFNGTVGATTPSTGAFTGINFGSTVAGNITDLSKHINLYGGNVGFNVTSGSLNYTVPSGSAHNFNINGSTGATITSTGINSTPIGAATPSTGAFTTLTANTSLSVGSPTATGQITTSLSGAAGSFRFIDFNTASTKRWELGVNNTSESGSNAGSDLYLQAFNDSGTLLFSAISIVRSTGLVTMGQGAAITGGSINSATIGATTPSTGAFTNLSATGTLSVSGATSFTSATSFHVQALTYASTITPNLSLGNYFTVTLTGNATLANPTNITAGTQYMFVITQDGTGSRTLSYGSVFKFANKTAPTLTTTAGAVDVLTCFSPDGVSLYAVLSPNFG